jgi:hypothetical protein
MAVLCTPGVYSHRETAERRSIAFSGLWIVLIIKRLEVFSFFLRNWILDTGYWILDTGYYRDRA